MTIIGKIIGVVVEMPHKAISEHHVSNNISGVLAVRFSSQRSRHSRSHRSFPITHSYVLCIYVVPGP